MKRLIGIRGLCLIILCFLFIKFASACERPFARQIADLLVANKIEEASTLLDEFSKLQPQDPMLALYRGVVLWARAQNGDKEHRDAMQQKAIDSLIKVEIHEKQLLSENPDQPNRQLALAMARGFVARLYLQQGSWFKAYSYGREARDGLRELISKYPEREDAYLLLGMYEYYTGSVSPLVKWLTVLIDLSGDSQLGIQYIQRAVQHAPVVAPEAARVLLREVYFPIPQTCENLPLAQHMREYYGTNPQFSNVLQDLYIACGQSENALQEINRAEQQYLAEYPKMKASLDFHTLIAYRELGDMTKVVALQSQFSDKPLLWQLNKAKTADIIGDRATAVQIYKEFVSDEDNIPVWIASQAHRYIDSPYQAFKPQTPSGVLKLNNPCS